jgi:hypothetical protein
MWIYASEPRDYGEWLCRGLGTANVQALPPGVDIDFDSSLYDNELFALGMDVELRLIGDTFEECKP